VSSPHILIAGIGNIFLGDDAFGVQVVQRLLRQPIPEGVVIKDFGIRGFDLAYAMMDDYDVTVLVDTLSRNDVPGTLYIIEPDLNAFGTESATIDAHSMDPVTVINLVKSLGGQPKRVLVVGCEPETFGPEHEGQMGLSAAVENALDEAVDMVQDLVAKLMRETFVLETNF
jgi:hydrogenase maturation protease